MKQNFRTILHVSEGGRIVIPAEVRERLGMEAGADLVLSVEEDHATLMNAKIARRKACEKVRRYVSPEISLSNELMAQRKKEAAHE